MSRGLARWIPLIIILIALGAVIFFRLDRYISFDWLQQHHRQLQTWVAHHYTLAVLMFMLIYIVAVTLSIPGATLLTLTSGFLFGIFPGALYVLISATLGACGIFLAVKTAVGQSLAKKARGWVRRLEKGFEENAFNYLLFLRLFPLFPFWVINIVPAILNVRLGVFIAATFLGIIPGTVVYVAVGSGLESILTKNQTPNLNVIFEPQILWPLLALALLSLIPIFYKKRRHRS